MFSIVIDQFIDWLNSYLSIVNPGCECNQFHGLFISSLRVTFQCLAAIFFPFNKTRLPALFSGQSGCIWITQSAVCVCMCPCLHAQFRFNRFPCNKWLLSLSPKRLQKSAKIDLFSCVLELDRPIPVGSNCWNTFQLFGQWLQVTGNVCRSWVRSSVLLINLHSDDWELNWWSESWTYTCNNLKFARGFE